MAVLSKPVDLDRLQKVLDDAAEMLPFHNDPVEPEPTFI
jgi:hypothetical protein